MDTINKNGIVKNINENELKIEILSCSACSSCMVKNYRTGFETKQKEIIIKNNNIDNFQIGDEVLVSIDEYQAFKSILLAYVIPLILMVLTVVGLLNYKNDEILAGICGIIILIPYYFGLFLTKNKLKSGFEFKISKKDANKNG